MGMSENESRLSPSAVERPSPDRHRVVVIGSGFGGLFAAQALKRTDCDVTLISRTTTHLFQPLLYQVATGILSMGEIAPATREILRRQQNATVLLGEVTDIDLAARTVTSQAAPGPLVTPYDSLVVAAGAGQSYFGNDHFAEFAPGMKSIDDALELRGRIFGSFELAERATDPEEVRRFLTFVVIGAGPTGVEMAGQISELCNRALKRDFRRIDTTSARIVLLDAAPAVLGPFGPKLSAEAERILTGVGVEVLLNAKVVGLDAAGVTYETADGQRTFIPAACKVWAAGVSASPLGALLAERSGAEVDRAGRVLVEPDLSAARASRGLHRRRHDRPGQPARGGAGGDPGRAPCGGDHPGEDRGSPRSRALRVPRQGQHGDHHAVQRRGQRRAHPDGRLHGLAALARRAPDVHRGVQEPPDDAGQLVGELRRAQPLRADDLGPAGGRPHPAAPRSGCPTRLAGSGGGGPDPDHRAPSCSVNGR